MDDGWREDSSDKETRRKIISQPGKRLGGSMHE